jgi:hypothetical protein
MRKIDDETRIKLFDNIDFDARETLYALCHGKIDAKLRYQTYNRVAFLVQVLESISNMLFDGGEYEYRRLHP